MGGQHNRRASVHLSEDAVANYIELGYYLHIIKTKLRGRCFNGNPAGLSRGLEGADVAEWIIAENTGKGLHTAPFRKEAFFGPALAGIQNPENMMDPLPIH